VPPGKTPRITLVCFTSRGLRWQSGVVMAKVIWQLGGLRQKRELVETCRWRFSIPRGSDVEESVDEHHGLLRESSCAA
jgi:hypothetical protein